TAALACRPSDRVLLGSGANLRRQAAAHVRDPTAVTFPGRLCGRRGLRDIACRSRGLRPRSGATTQSRRDQTTCFECRVESNLPLRLLERSHRTDTAPDRPGVEPDHPGAAGNALP